MQDFNDIQAIWKQSQSEVSTPKIDIQKIKSNKMKLRNKWLIGSLLLALTGIFILVLMRFLDENIKTNIVVVSMIVIAMICFIQAILQYIIAMKMNAIDETQKPEKLLQQWQEFQAFQKNIRHWNMPLYYILLGTGLGFYFYEILKNASLSMKIIVYAASYGWMIFAYFYLGKRELKKQDAKFDAIISELKGLEQQFK